MISACLRASQSLGVLACTRDQALGRGARKLVSKPECHFGTANLTVGGSRLVRRGSSICVQARIRETRLQASGPNRNYSSAAQGVCVGSTEFQGRTFSQSPAHVCQAQYSQHGQMHSDHSSGYTANVAKRSVGYRSRPGARRIAGDKNVAVKAYA